MNPPKQVSYFFIFLLVIDDQQDFILTSQAKSINEILDTLSAICIEFNGKYIVPSPVLCDALKLTEYAWKNIRRSKMVELHKLTAYIHQAYNPRKMKHNATYIEINDVTVAEILRCMGGKVDNLTVNTWYRALAARNQCNTLDLNVCRDMNMDNATFADYLQSANAPSTNTSYQTLPYQNQQYAVLVDQMSAFKPPSVCQTSYGVPPQRAQSVIVQPKKRAVLPPQDDSVSQQQYDSVSQYSGRNHGKMEMDEDSDSDNDVVQGLKIPTETKNSVIDEQKLNIQDPALEYASSLIRSRSLEDIDPEALKAMIDSIQAIVRRHPERNQWTWEQDLLNPMIPLKLRWSDIINSTEDKIGVNDKGKPRVKRNVFKKALKKLLRTQNAICPDHITIYWVNRR